MISPETTNDILGEIAHSLHRIANALNADPVIEAQRERRRRELERDIADPFHDEGNATNHRVSQCDENCR